MIATMRPKSPMASAKMRIRIMPTNSFGSMAFIRTPMSPTTPMAKPDAYPVMIQNTYNAREAAAQAGGKVLVAHCEGVVLGCD